MMMTSQPQQTNPKTTPPCPTTPHTHPNTRLTYPLINSIFGYWVPPSERGRALAVSNIGAGLGAISSLALAPVISAKHGWATVLYGSGWAGTDGPNLFFISGVYILHDNSLLVP